MIKAKEVANFLVFILVIGAVFSLYMVNNHRVTQTQPTFIYQEVKVQKTAAAAARVAEAVQVLPSPMPASAPPIFPPRIISQIAPEYPASAIEKGIEGVVVIQAVVGANGKPEKVEVKSGNAELNASAVNAVSQWVFSPATQGGAAISSIFEVPVRFSLK